MGIQKTACLPNITWNRFSGPCPIGEYAQPAGSHIDVAAYDARGVLIEETTAEYKGGYIAENNRKKDGARFSATLTKPLPEGAVIKLALHKDDQRNVDKPKPVHEKTLAK